MKKYIKYFKYVIEHKKNVFKICWKNKKYIHAFTHDLSKFRPCEFIPYARWFYGEYGVDFLNNRREVYEKEFSKGDYDSLKFYGVELGKHYVCKRSFDWAWIHHYKRNKHHWNHYVDYTDMTCKKMPYKHIMQMIYDWEAMGIKFNNTAQEYYLKNYHDIKLNRDSRVCLEKNLGLHKMLNASYCEGNWEHYATLYEIVRNYDKHIMRDKILNDLFVNIDNKYGVNTLELIGNDKLV